MPQWPPRHRGAVLQTAPQRAGQMLPPLAWLPSRSELSGVPLLQVLTWSALHVARRAQQLLLEAVPLLVELAGVWAWRVVH